MRCCICGKEIVQGFVSDGKYFCSQECYRMSWPKCTICGKPMDQWIQDEHGKKYCSQKCYEKILPHCTVCGKVMNQWIESNGKKYCSESCFEESWPKCCICGKPMKTWIEADGKKYCGESCYQKILPKCEICKKPMKEWIEADDGRKYCSQPCFEKSWPRCCICGRPMNHWTETKDGKKYCSEACFEKTLDRCAACGKPVNGGVIDKSTGKKYCSEKCFETILPRCSACGKIMKQWIQTEKGEKYCSETCLQTVLPKCKCCGRPMKKWIDYQGVGKFCSEECYQRYQKKIPTNINENTALTPKELSYLVGLSEEECENMMKVNHMNGDDALEMIDIYMSCLQNKMEVPTEITISLQKAGVYSKLSANLGKYNTMRGGVKGYKGFVFEEMHAADQMAKGKNIAVLNDNGIADFLEITPVGDRVYMQAKAGYRGGQIDWNRYKGQTIVVDKGNHILADQARNAGLKVVESDVSVTEASLTARAQQLESALLKTKNAPITATAVSAHYAGIQSMKAAAKVGVGFHLGSNIYDVLNEHKSFEEAAADVIVDSAVMAGAAYVGGSALTVAGSIAGGMAAAAGDTAIGAAVAAAGEVAAGTSAGGAIVAGITGGIEVITGVAAAIEAAPLAAVVGITAAVGFLYKCLTDD